MPRPKPEFDDDDIDDARKKGEQLALAQFQAGAPLWKPEDDDEGIGTPEDQAMEMSEEMFPARTERQRRAYGHEIKDAAERLYAKLKDLAS